MSAPYIKDWINDHPAGDISDAYLWCRIRKFKVKKKKDGKIIEEPMPSHPTAFKKPISYSNAALILEKLAKISSIKKKVNPHAFRHTRAIILASHLTEAQMNKFFGWEQG